MKNGSMRDNIAIFILCYIFIYIYIYIYEIVKTMCPPGYHHNGFVATHALGHMIYIYIYIWQVYIYIHIWHLGQVQSFCAGSHVM